MDDRNLRPYCQLLPIAFYVPIPGRHNGPTVLSARNCRCARGVSVIDHIRETTSHRQYPLLGIVNFPWVVGHAVEMPTGQTYKRDVKRLRSLAGLRGLGAALIFLEALEAQSVRLFQDQ